jgi:PAS domain S-box-containing protein
MSQLLRPAIALMNRLRYPQKFLLISLLFILPLALVISLLIAEVNTKVSFAQKEANGTEYLRAVRKLFEDALHEQSTARAYMNGDLALAVEFQRAQAQIDDDLAALGMADSRLGGPLRTTASFNVLNTYWRELKSKLPASSARMSDDLHATLIADIRGLIALVGDTSNGIITIGDDGWIDSVNPAAARIFGYSAGEITGQPIQLLIPVPHDQQYQVIGIGREVIGQRKDGTAFPLDLAIGEMRLGDQHRYIGMAHDLTERKRAAEEHARLQERIIQAQAATLAELSTPLIPISDQIVVMPLIGAIDSDRARLVLETLLRGIERSHARVAILDITGVPLVDTQVAKSLLVAAQAVRLLGAQIVLTGIRPEVAQTLVGLGVDLGDIVTHSSLQSGIAYATKEKSVGSRR